MAGHSVCANLLMLMLLIGGLFVGFKIKKEVFPDFELDIVSIMVPYPGAGPEEVERGILLAIEESLQGLDGIKDISATAGEGMARVTVEILEGENIQRLAQDIQNEVDRITSMPEDIEQPRVTIAQRKRYVVSLVLYGDHTERVMRETAETIRDRLLQDPQITQVSLVGVRDPEIAVEIPIETLRAHGLTLDAVADVIARSAVDLPGGAIKSSSGDILVRMTERRDWASDFARLPIITTDEGTEVFLEDLAVIRDGFEETDRFATYNGLPAIGIDVYRVGDQTPLSVANAVHRQVAQLNAQLPPGFTLEARNDRSKIYRQRMDLMLRNGYLGLALVFVLLALFLEPRLAFWVSLGIPISFLGGLLMLKPMGMSINMISMFAFIITLGIVVDDAIVVGENVFFYRQSGKSWPAAAIAGTREIAVPITFSVLTNMVTFVPMFFVPGIMGKVFRQIPMVVVSVFFISLIESLFILPAHLGHRRQARSGGLMGWITARQQTFSRGFSRAVENLYGPFLQWLLGYRYVVLAAAVAVLSITFGFIKSGRMGFELFPKVESDYARVSLALPHGAPVQQVLDAQRKLVQAARQVADKHGGDKLLEGVFASIDGSAVEVRAYMTDPKIRPISTSSFTRLWRQSAGALPGLESIKFESDAGGPGSGAALSIDLSHRDIGVLEAAGASLAAALDGFANVSDIDDGFAPGKAQIDITMLPAGTGEGLTAGAVARQIRHAYYGAEALRQQRGRDEMKVMVRLPRAQRESEFYFEQMLIRTPDGGEMPITEAAQLSRGRAYIEIQRRNGRRVITVSADVRPRSQAGQVLGELKLEFLPALKQRYPGLIYSFEGRQADQRESMQTLLRGMGAALLVIYAMLAVAFNSYAQPLIIMLSIPFGIVGAVIGHLAMGYSLSVMSMFGIVALTGVVVNDALVFIDFANRRMREGMAPAHALHMAALQRFRPILLTTLTTFGGLAPMIFETSRQARFLIPMAISLGFGILFATVITLILVPAMVLIHQDLRNLFRPAYASEAR